MHEITETLSNFVNWLVATAAAIVSGIGTVGSTCWDWTFNLLSTDGPELRQFAEVSLYATLAMSLVTLVLMVYLRPRRRLDQGYFMRELGISCVIGVLLCARVFGWFSRPWILVGYLLLLVSSIYIAYGLVHEHQLSDKEIAELIEEENDKYA